jgi:hypothetical protein
MRTATTTIFALAGISISLKQMFMMPKQTLIYPLTRSGAAGIAITGAAIIRKTRLGRTRIMSQISSRGSSQ